MGEALCVTVAASPNFSAPLHHQPPRCSSPPRLSWRERRPIILLHTRDYAVVVTLFRLGVRASELCGLRLEETDLARGTI